MVENNNINLSKRINNSVMAAFNLLKTYLISKIFLLLLSNDKIVNLFLFNQ